MKMIKSMVTMMSIFSGGCVYTTEEELQPFCGHKLTLEPVQSSDLSCVLVHYSDPSLTQDHLFLYLDQYEEVVECEMHSEVTMAVVRFSQNEGET
jgi:hypothetical protein